MTSRTSAGYQAVLNYVVSVVDNFRPPASLMADFEPALRSVFTRLWPGIEIKGCWFHYSQGAGYQAVLDYVVSVVDNFRPPASLMADFEPALRSVFTRLWPGIEIKGCWFHYSQGAGYQAVLDYVVNVVDNFRPPASLMADFEPALRSVFTRLWPSIEIKGCWFHYSQALWKRAVSTHRLLPLSRRSGEAKRVYDLLNCLPLVPPHNMDEALEVAEAERALWKRAVTSHRLLPFLRRSGEAKRVYDLLNCLPLVPPHNMDEALEVAEVERVGVRQQMVGLFHHVEHYWFNTIGRAVSWWKRLPHKQRGGVVLQSAERSPRRGEPPQLLRVPNLAKYSETSPTKSYHIVGERFTTSCDIGFFGSKYELFVKNQPQSSQSICFTSALPSIPRHPLQSHITLWVKDLRHHVTLDSLDPRMSSS
ncbi:hypothetical protein M8J76_015268 [Diaphorina citri]|nr:hypothetical protein M8J76_015268 [Diaphorina citri]